MRVHSTFTTVIKVWKEISTIPLVRDAVVNIFGQFMDIHLGNFDNRLIQALTEHWWPTTHTFLFPCTEIEVTHLDFQMLTSLSIGRYLTQVPYDNAWSVLSKAKQMLPNIDFSHIKSGNVSISHLRTYLTIAAVRKDNITIACAFILFMMGHLWFAILASLNHGLDTAVMTGGAITGFAQLLTYWFYEYYGVGHLMFKEDVKYLAYLYLRACDRGNRKKTNDQTYNLFMLGRYYIDHQTIEMITWRPWLESAVSELNNVWVAALLSPTRMPLKVLNRNCEYYLGDRCWRQLTESARDAQMFQDLTGEVTTLRRHLDSADDQLHAHDLYLRRGRDVRVVPLPSGGGAGTKQRGSGPQTRGGGSGRSGTRYRRVSKFRVHPELDMNYIP
ncbi:hypothetical protein GIB67_020140 [Kingdonia uniflora]|uniref:Aminotransferase-like plant mobile domain-containing protein n=1 Tax=Kingdonia uniflora TaxID=39325 RepID=A0A7J7NI32_9MAGN|nr:hypothetical protein GIB67_020140 [Kingdonia uniflora]